MVDSLIPFVLSCNIVKKTFDKRSSKHFSLPSRKSRFAFESTLCGTKATRATATTATATTATTTPDGAFLNVH